MTEIKPLQNMWVVVDELNQTYEDCIRDLKGDAIKAYIKYYGLGWDWPKWRSNGYRCINVDISFKEVK